jgi:hypothetical protein
MVDGARNRSLEDGGFGVPGLPNYYLSLNWRRMEGWMDWRWRRMVDGWIVEEIGRTMDGGGMARHSRYTFLAGSRNLLLVPMMCLLAGQTDHAGQRWRLFFVQHYHPIPYRVHPICHPSIHPSIHSSITHTTLRQTHHRRGPDQ